MNTWKILLADDEPKIRRGIRSVLETLNDRFTVVAEAEDGQMALELAKEHRPDILLVDIRMPILNGLELIERLNAFSNDWLIIIISGHDEFDFAQQAIRLKVFDFLLKPVARTAFAAALDGARAELSERRKNGHMLEWTSQHLEENLPALRESFMRKVFSESLSSSEIEENLSFLKISFDKNYSIIAFRIVERVLKSNSQKESYRRLMLINLKTIVSEVLNTYLESKDGSKLGLGIWRHDANKPQDPIIFEDEKDTIVALVQPIDSKGISQVFELIESKSSETIQHIPSMVTAQTSNGLQSILEVYEQLSDELTDRSNTNSFIQTIQNFLELHYKEPGLSLETAAQEIQLSPGYLSRILKQKTGASFVDYLTKLRVKKATQLMTDPSIRIFEIADKTGFRSQHYFSRAFRKILGISPTEFRKGPEE